MSCEASHNLKRDFQKQTRLPYRVTFIYIHETASFSSQILETEQRIIFRCLNASEQLCFEQLTFTTNVCCLNQHAKTLFIRNLPCSRAKVFGNCDIVCKAKLLDFTVLLLSDQTVNMRQLFVWAVNSTFWHVSFLFLLIGNYTQHACAAQIEKLKCCLYAIRLVLKQLQLSI